MSYALAWGDQLEALQATGVDWKVAAKWLINEQPPDNDAPLPSASDALEFKAVILASEGRISSAGANYGQNLPATRPAQSS